MSPPRARANRHEPAKMPAREWYAERVPVQDLADHLNQLEAARHKIVACLNTAGVRGSAAILVVSVKQKGG